MAKISKLSKTEQFTSLQKTSCEINERNDCSVKAVALFCDVSYEAAHAELKRLGRKDRCGCQEIIIRKAVENLQGKVFLVDHHKWVKQYPSPHHNLKSMTTYHPVRFAQVFSKIKGKFLIFVNGHVCVMIDGVIHDWSNDKAMRVQSVWA